LGKEQVEKIVALHAENLGKEEEVKLMQEEMINF
jgi:hypothetical protein